MMVDPLLRKKLDSTSPFTPFDEQGFTSLSEDDRKALIDIFKFPLHAPKGDDASNDVCETEWGSDCFLRTIWWEYPPETIRGTKKVIHHPHSHPVPLPAPTAARRK